MVLPVNAEENRQLVRSILEPLAAGDTRPFVEAMADDFRWRFAGTWSWARDWGSTRGEVRARLLQPLMAQFADYRLRVEEIITEGEVVVIRAQASATTIRGDAYPQAYCYVFRIAGGQVAEVLEYCDTALVERVLELPATDAR